MTATTGTRPAPLIAPAVTIARLVLGGVWIAAGASKLTDLDASVRAVRAYRLLPETAAQIVGAGLPPVEILLGVLLVVGAGVRVSAVVSALLMSAFVVGIASAWVRGLRIDCGCFGSGGELAAGEDPTYGLELARDGGLLLLSLLVAARPPGRLALDGVVRRPEGEPLMASGRSTSATVPGATSWVAAAPPQRGDRRSRRRAAVRRCRRVRSAPPRPARIRQRRRTTAGRVEAHRHHRRANRPHPRYDRHLPRLPVPGVQSLRGADRLPRINQLVCGRTGRGRLSPRGLPRPLLQHAVLHPLLAGSDIRNSV